MEGKMSQLFKRLAALTAVCVGMLVVSPAFAAAVTREDSMTSNGTEKDTMAPAAVQENSMTAAETQEHYGTQKHHGIQEHYGMRDSEEQIPQELDGREPQGGDDFRETSQYVRTKEEAALPAPETVTQEKISYNSVTVNWSSVENAAGYQISYMPENGDDTVAGTTTADVQTYTCKGLVTGMKYEFRVCALDETGRAGAYTGLQVQPVLKKTKFTSVTAPQMNKVVLEWKKAAGAMNYELYRKSSGQEEYELLVVTAEPAYTDEAVTAGESYSYQVRAIRDENGTTVQAAFSAVAQIQLSSAAMQFESCEALDYHSVKLSWKQDLNASGYYIYRSVKENGTYRKIKTITKQTVLNYTDTKIVPGKKFFYKICTYKKSGQSVETGEQSQAVQAQTQAEGPQLVTVKTNVGNRSLSLEWKKSSSAAGYRIYRSEYPDKGFAKIKDLNSQTFVGYEDRAVVPGGTYYYRIKGIYTNGTYKGLSSPSTTMEGNVTPCAPIGLTVTQTGEDTLLVSWESVAGADSYHLYCSDTADGTYRRIAKDLTDTSYTDTGIQDGQARYYRVSASGAAGEGILCHAVSYTAGGISLNTRTLKLSVGVTKPLEAFTFLESEVEWTSANTEVAQVDEQGNVTGIAYGTTKVTATADGKSASAVISVTPGSRNGIDVSRWQEDVDWRRVKNSGVEFAFLRISNHNLEDYTFETKYQNASAVEMPMGVYCYSRAKTVEEAQEEARIVLEILNGRKLDYPIALDLEDAVHKAKTMKKETLHQMIHAFKDIVEEAGYQFVLYSYLTFLNNNLDRTKLDGIDLWIARYRNVSLGTGYTGAGTVRYWQYNSGQYNGSNAQVDGITKETGELVSVDVNVEYDRE